MFPCGLLMNKDGNQSIGAGILSVSMIILPHFHRNAGNQVTMGWETCHIVHNHVN